MSERTISTAEPARLARPRPAALDGGRLGVFSTLGALTGAVPLPWLPDTLARRVRGALLHDVAARHGLSLTPEARDVLSEPSGTEGPRGIVAGALHYLGLRLLVRLGPLAVVPPLRAAVQTFVLGHLFNHYLDTARTERAVRVDVEEARRVRQAIDHALVHAVTVAEARAEGAPAAAPEDLRDATTAMIDGVLTAAAGLPGWLLRRLEAAFEELLPQTHG
jgi:hypothetical protein